MKNTKNSCRLLTSKKSMSVITGISKESIIGKTTYIERKTLTIKPVAKYFIYSTPLIT